jgi:predicted AlkP superfamily phosphohydrolase/phosphomutase
VKTFKRKAKRACVVGLDGVPHSLLCALMESGIMPATRRIVERGVLRSMTVTLPEISSVSWSTFMTGRNPGEHGIFGFTDLKAGTYDLRFPSFRDLKTETIWDRLGKAGMRSVVVNQPSTYPAREIPGVLIAGFVAIDIEKAVYPRRHLPLLARTGYRVDVDTETVRDHPKRLLDELSSLLGCRQAVVDALWDSEEWNLMEVVVTGTDRLHHFLWDAWESPSHPYHQGFLDYYRKVDAFIDRIHTRFNEESGESFFLLSDHGFCGTRNELYINTILEQAGFLTFDGPAGAGLAAIGEESRAFALDPARVYVHRKGRFPKGRIAADEVSSIKQELTALFESVEHAGEKIVRRVFDADDVYVGPLAPQGPDLLLIPKNGYDMKGRLRSPSIVGERRLQGMHTWDDAFFYSARSDLVPKTDEPTIVDVPRMVLRSLDVEM